MSKLAGIEILNIVRTDTPKSIYIIDGECLSREDYLVIYNNAVEQTKPLGITKHKLSLEKVIKILEKNNVSYKRLFTLDHDLLREVNKKFDYVTCNLFLLTVASLLTIESEEKPSFVNRSESFNYLASYNMKETQTISPEFIKSVLLSASKINFYHLQVLSTCYDIVWNILKKQDLASLFTKEEAMQVYKKVFIPEYTKDEVLITPGWIKLFCMVEDPNIIYEKFFSQTKEVMIRLFSLHEVEKSTDTYGSEKVIFKLLREKRPRVVIIDNFSYRILCDGTSLTGNNNLTLAMFLLLLMEHLKELNMQVQTQKVIPKPGLKVEKPNVEQKMFESLLVELKTTIREYFSSSPFLVLLFYSIPRIMFDFPHNKEKEFGKIFIHHFSDFLLSVPDTLLRKQRFKEIEPLDKFITFTLLMTDLDTNLVEALTEKCLKIENFPLEVFLFYPGIRQCKTYNKLVSKVAKSEKRVVDYIRMFKTIENKKEIPNLPSLLEEYKAIYSDIEENMSLDALRKVIRRKYVVNNIDSKLRVLALSSEEDRIGFKRCMMLKEMGLYKGDIQDVIRVIFDIHKISNSYDLMKFIGRFAKQATDNEFEVFVRMLSKSVEIVNEYVHITKVNGDEFLKKVNINHALLTLRKVKETVEK